VVAGCQLIWTAYGWWLPHDPRGDLGELHYGRKLAQPSGREIKLFYEEARHVLEHPLLTFDDEKINLIAASFARNDESASSGETFHD
jgi:hypothetical protein